MINLINGQVTIHEEDFSLPGPIPFVWQRNLFSDIPRETLLGSYWHCNYDQHLIIDKEGDSFLWQNSNGNILELPYLAIDDEAVVTSEKIKYKHQKNKVIIEDYDQDLIYHYAYAGGASDTYQLKQIKRNRFAITFFYTHNGILDHIIDASGRIIKIATDDKQRIVTISLVADTGLPKTLVRYEYNEDNKLSVVYDAIDQPASYQYTGDQLTRVIDRNKNSQYWEYKTANGEAQCVARWYTYKKGYESFVYDKDKTIVTDARGAVTTHYHQNGNITQVQDAKGNTEQWEYNIDSELIRYTDALGYNTYYGYDEYGNQTSVRLPNGGVTSYIYENNKLVMAKNAHNALWIWKYTEDGLLSSRIGPDNDVTRYEYTDDLLIKIIDANGQDTQLEYNKHAILEKVILPNGEETLWKYNSQGQLLTAVSSQEATTGYKYDPLGRVNYIRTPDGNEIALTYDGIGNVIKAKDDHHQVAFDYSATGKLISRKENDTKIQFKYNSTDQLQAITNEHKSIYQFTRDKLGNIIKENGFDGLERVYTRDAGGRVSQLYTPNGNTTQYTYDTLGNISKIIHQDKSEEVFSYDRMGALISAANPHGKVLLERDTLGRILTETQDQITINSKYNRLGERIHIESSLGADIEITRNKDGMVSATHAIQADAQWQVEITRNQLGQEIERNLPGAVASKWERDAMGRPRQHSVNVKEKSNSKKTYHWDVNDRLRGIYDQITQSMTRFSHDLFGNLASAEYQDGSWDYKLPDEIGNLFKTKEQTDRTYGKAGQLLKDEEYTYSYDALGNLIKKENLTEAWEYVWTQTGMLSAVLRPDKKWIQYTYDALGRRLTKTYNKQTTHYVWDGNVLLHEWQAEAGATHTSINEDGELEIETPKNLITWIFEEGTFVPQAKLQNGKAYSIITDHLGTPFEAYDEQGKKVWSCSLGIYGKVRTITGSNTFIPFRYQGQYEDVETGLYYNRFRYYSPDSGTYISQDPIGLESGEPNFYTYVKDSNSKLDVFGLHEAIGILNGNAVTTPSGGYSWYSDRGSSKNKFNGYGAAGHSEAKMLEHIEKNYPNLKGSKLEIISMGQLTKGGKSQLSTLPPCKRCMDGLEAFAKKNGMDITYKWDGGSKEFKGCK